MILGARECTRKNHRTTEEAHCEEHFDATTTRDSTGRVNVSLSFKAEGHSLGQSRASAMRHFNDLENELKRANRWKTGILNLLMCF